MIPALLGASIVTHTPVFALFALTTSLALAGCRGEDPVGTATEVESTSEGTGSTGATPTTSGTTAEPTTGTSTTGTPTTTNNSNGFITTDSSGGPATTGDVGPQPNGAQCMNDDECESKNCYSSVLLGGGVCSECNADADCAAPLISCTISPVMMYAVCEDGSAGDNCSSEDACQDELFCEDLIPIPGVIPGFCSDCAESTDCPMGQICSPTLDLVTFSGKKGCVEPGSVENGGLCPLDEADGDMACMSGKCAAVSVMGFVMLGVCGECESDADCMGGTCTPGELGMGGIAGSVCE